MKKETYKYIQHGFEAILYDAENGDEGQKKNIRAIPLEQFQAAADEMKKHGYKRIGIYGNSKGRGMALLAASVVSDISLVIAASAFGHIMQGTGKPSEDPCKAMVSFRGEDFPYVEKGKLFSDFLKRCVKEKNIRLLYFPVNNNMLPREKKYPNECQRAREETLDLIIRALDAWCV